MRPHGNYDNGVVFQSISAGDLTSAYYIYMETLLSVTSYIVSSSVTPMVTGFVVVMETGHIVFHITELVT